MLNKIKIFLSLIVFVLISASSVYGEEDKSESFDAAVEKEMESVISVNKKYMDENIVTTQKLKEDIFQTISEIRTIIKNVRALFIDTEQTSQPNPYRGLNNMEAIKRNAVPLYMISPEITGVGDLEDTPWGYKLLNIFGGLVNVETVGRAFNHKYFKITYSGLPSTVCEALLLTKWGDEFLGNVYIGANGKFWAWNEDLSKNKLPIIKEEAEEICEHGGYFEIGWR